MPQMDPIELKGGSRVPEAVQRALAARRAAGLPPPTTPEPVQRPRDRMDMLNQGAFDKMNFGDLIRDIFTGGALRDRFQEPQPRGMLNGMSHDDLLSMRAGAPPEEQASIAPYEHGAYAREWTQDNPMKAAVAMPLMIPGYTAAKAMGLMEQDENSTPPSLAEMREGFKGFGNGMLSALRGRGAPVPAQRMGVSGRMIPRPGMLQRPQIPSAVGVRG